MRAHLSAIAIPIRNSVTFTSYSLVPVSQDRITICFRWQILIVAIYEVITPVTTSEFVCLFFQLSLSFVFSLQPS